MVQASHSRNEPCGGETKTGVAARVSDLEEAVHVW